MLAQTQDDVTQSGDRLAAEPPTHDNQKRPLTFGIELEFLVSAQIDSHDPLRRIPRSPNNILQGPKTSSWDNEEDESGWTDTMSPEMTADLRFQIEAEFRARGLPVVDHTIQYENYNTSA